MLQGFATINYCADDVEAAKRWYAELRGLEPYFERRRPDGRLAYAEFRVGRLPAQARPGRSALGAARRDDGYWRRNHVLARRRPRRDLRPACRARSEYEPITPRGDAGS
jgi:hypothetical protein